APPAPGETCTLVGSPLSFVNTATGSTATLSLQSNVRDLATGGTTPGTVVYTMQFEGKPYQQVFATIFGAGGTVATSYSAEFNSANGSAGIHGGVNLTSTGLTFQSGAVSNRASVGWPWPSSV